MISLYYHNKFSMFKFYFIFTDFSFFQLERMEKSQVQARLQSDAPMNLTQMIGKKAEVEKSFTTRLWFAFNSYCLIMTY